MTDQSTHETGDESTDETASGSASESNGGIERRDLLKGAAAAGLGGLGFAGSAATHPKPNTIALRAVAVPVQYEIVVSGEIAKGPKAGGTDQIVDGNVARGFLGTVGELDDYRFSGQVTAFNVDVVDALAVFVNGTRVADPVGLPAPELANAIRVRARGQAVPYTFAVSGSVQKGPNADGNDRIVDGNAVEGTVDAGDVDDFRYSGAISFESGDGPLEVTLLLG